MDAADKAYVISVTLMKGCYRHIRISADAMLVQLSSEILSAFYFDDDHAHAFFMDNRAWSDANSYYMDMEDDDEDEKMSRHTDDYTLRQAGLAAESKFLYIFDFGEEWRFQCRVLKVLDEQVEKAEVIRSVGEPPRQYA